MRSYFVLYIYIILYDWFGHVCGQASRRAHRDRHTSFQLVAIQLTYSFSSICIRRPLPLLRRIYDIEARIGVLCTQAIGAK